MSQKKCVIIGSGLGGLSCGVILAKNGYDVTVLEKHYQIGGCLQCFSRKGVKFESGMHFIGSASPGQTLDRMLRYLEVSDAIELSPLDPLGYNVILLNGQTYRMANGRDNFIRQLLPSFPHAQADLERYYDLIRQVAGASRLHSLRHTETMEAIQPEYLTRSINDVMEQTVADPLLRDVLMGALPLYAAEKNKTPFATHAFVTDFYNQSAYRVVGGSDHIARALQATIERYGGKVITKQEVTHIECDDQRAVAALTAEGNRYEADVLISDLHPARTLELTDSPLLRPAYRRRLRTLPNTIGGFSVYLKFKPHAVPYMNYNLYGYRSPTPWGCESYTAETWPKGYLYMHTCQEQQQQYAQSGIILSYMQYADVARWEGTTIGRRGEDYETFKRQHAERLIAAVEHDLPGFSEGIEEYFTSTPLTYRDYTGTEAGGMYGIARDITLGPAARVHHLTRVPNLLLTGQNINSHGILGVLVGTIITCSELLGSEELFRQISEK